MNTIPHDIAALTSLEYLGLNSVGITEFPKGICSLTNLKELHIENFYWNDFDNMSTCGCRFNNKIEKIPSCISNLSNLQYLTISYQTNYSDIEEFLFSSTVKFKAKW